MHTTLKSLSTIFFCLLLILISFKPIYANEQSNGYAVDHDVFELPGRGELSMRVPKIWDYNFTWVDENQPPLITFFVPDDKQAEIFQLNMSVLWDDGFGRNISTPEFVRSLVEQTGEEILTMSDQTELILHEITGTTGTGYLFDLSDSSAGKGEYKYLTQGAISLGEILLIFSLFSNDEDSLLREATLQMVMSATHDFRKDV